MVAAGRRLQDYDDGPRRVSNIVFMGMGEALANYRAAIGALRRLTDPLPDGLGLSARGLTMSTVGLVPAIDRLATVRADGKSLGAYTAADILQLNGLER